MFTLNKIRFNKVLKYSDGMRISYIKDKEFYKYSNEYIYKIIKRNS